MRYVVVEEFKDSSSFEDFDDLMNAIRYMDIVWNLNLTLRKYYKQLYLLDSDNPDPESIDHLAGRIIKRYV